MTPPRNRFRVVADDGQVEEKGVYCKECGAKVVSREEFSTVRVGPEGELLGTPFACLRHRCPKPVL